MEKVHQHRALNVIRQGAELVNRSCYDACNTSNISCKSFAGRSTEPHDSLAHDRGNERRKAVKQSTSAETAERQIPLTTVYQTPERQNGKCERNKPQPFEMLHGEAAVHSIKTCASDPLCIPSASNARSSRRSTLVRNSSTPACRECTTAVDDGFKSH